VIKPSKCNPIAIVLYNPSLQSIGRILEHSERSVKFYIFDNSPNDISRKLSQIDNVTYITSGDNIGLGLSLKILCSTAYYCGEEGLLFFDQDTVFCMNTLDFISATININSLKREKYILINYLSSGINKNVLVNDIPLAINSCSFFILENLHELNWHNSSYYVDGVDYELCIRSSIMGYKIGSIGGAPNLDHEIEQGAVEYSIFGNKKKSRIYPFYRIKDIVISSIRLELYSILNFQFKYSILIIKILLKFLASQVYLRVGGYKI